MPTVNLAPADMRKAVPAYDLPIAVGLLLASEQLCGQVERALFVGELGLDGALRHTDGVLPMVSIVKSHGIDTLDVPFEDVAEAGLVEGTTVIPVQTLTRRGYLIHLRQIAPSAARHRPSVARMPWASRWVSATMRAGLGVSFGNTRTQIASGRFNGTIGTVRKGATVFPQPHVGCASHSESPSQHHLGKLGAGIEIDIGPAQPGRFTLMPVPLVT